MFIQDTLPDSDEADDLSGEPQQFLEQLSDGDILCDLVLTCAWQTIDSNHFMQYKSNFKSV